MKRNELRCSEMKGTKRKNQSAYIMLVVMNPGVVVKPDASYQDSLVNLALEISQEKDLKRKPAGLKGSKGGDKQYVKISPHKKNIGPHYLRLLYS